MAQMDLKAVISAEDKTHGAFSSFGSKLASFGANVLKVAGVATAALAGLAVVIGKKMVEEAIAGENAMAQTKAVIKSTGGVAKVTAKQVDDLATSLQNTTGYADDVIQSGENLLLTFTNIGKNIFPEATEVMLNMSRALGQDVKSSAIQLGKALQDPILGVTALRRVGVNFNEDAKETIKKFVETNQLAKAQAFILKELQVEFGGAAKAYGKTFAGQMDIAKEKLNAILEVGGKVIIEFLQPMLTWIGNLIVKLNEWVIKMGGVEGIHAKLAETFKRLKDRILEVANTIIYFFTQTALGVGILAGFEFGIKALIFAWSSLWSIIVKNKEEFKILGYGLLFLTGTVLATFIGTVTALGFILTGLAWIIARVIDWFRMWWNVIVYIGRVLTELDYKISMHLINPIMRLINWIQSAINWFNSLGATAKRILSGITGVNINVLNKILGKASGGYVQSGQPYIVGERGAELFVPSQSGNIIPNDKLGTGNQITVNFYGNLNNSTNMSVDEAGRLVARQIELALRGAM